jgi:hypothetical protein
VCVLHVCEVLRSAGLIASKIPPERRLAEHLVLPSGLLSWLEGSYTVRSAWFGERLGSGKSRLGQALLVCATSAELNPDSSVHPCRAYLS